MSSLLAVVIIEVYRLARRWGDQRPLRKMLDSSKDIVIIVPSYPVKIDKPTRSVLSIHDVYALTHVTEACRRIGATTRLVSSAQLPDDFSNEFIVAVAGPYSNEKTKLYLNSYCATFQTIESDRYTRGFKCSEREFSEDDGRGITWAYIVRLDPDVTGQKTTMILVWGTTALATASAAYYFAEHTRELMKFNKSFFVALRINRNLGYRCVPTTPINISEVAIGSGGK
ncbi:MAG: hypothetical protein ACRDS1_10320 [Pseudonocardiaceae bacterium]